VAASYQKPAGEKVTRHQPKLAWVNLPRAGRPGKPPPLPEDRIWQPATKKWWAKLWAKPQAVMWDQSGSSLFLLACLYDDVYAQRVTAGSVSAEVRQHEDRHGLNPKAMGQLCWRIPDEDETEEQGRPAARRSNRYGHLRPVED
jgi:hypothetical protein